MVAQAVTVVVAGAEQAAPVEMVLLEAPARTLVEVAGADKAEVQQAPLVLMEAPALEETIV